MPSSSSIEIPLLLRLVLEPGLGPVSVRALLDHFGGADALWGASETALLETPGIAPRQARAALHARGIDPRPEEEEAGRLGVALVPPGDPRYPEALRRTRARPCLLYAKGGLEPRDHRAAGIVGTRGASQYALDQAARFAGELARAGFAVVSGMARGVDVAAHRGALAAGGRTVAVLGCGLGSGMDRLYLDDDGRLAASIVAAGAMVSEFPLAWPPSRQTFPRRNRIIAAWGLGLLVVEAPPRSGSLITAANARDLGRPVFALPGRVDQPGAAGCHGLIREGAHLAASPADLLPELAGLARAAGLVDPDGTDLEGAGSLVAATDGPAGSAAAAEAANAAAAPAAADQALLRALQKDPLAPDQLAALADMPVGEVNARLLLMEMRRSVKRLPGGRYIATDH